MRRNILFIAMLLAFTGVQAQVLFKHGENKEKIEFGSDKLVKMVFTYNGENNGDDIYFIRQSGDTLTFDIDEIYAMGFAEDFTKIEEVKQAGEPAIVYNATAHVVYVVNSEGENGVIRIFNAEGRLVKSAEGTSISVADLSEGLYIVSYNMELNAKIVKK